MSKMPNLREKEIRERLRVRYAPPEWFLSEEVTLIGRTEDSERYFERRADMVAFNMYGSRGHSIEVFEIKCTRADLLNELRRPEKAEPFFTVADKFWLVLGSKEIWHRDIDQIPSEWGVILPSGKRLRVYKQAQLLEGRPASRQFFARLVKRALGYWDMQENIDQKERAAYSRGLEEGRKRGSHRTRELLAIVERWRAFKAIFRDCWQYETISNEALRKKAQEFADYLKAVDRAKARLVALKRALDQAENVLEQALRGLENTSTMWPWSNEDDDDSLGK